MEPGQPRSNRNVQEQYGLTRCRDSFTAYVVTFAYKLNRRKRIRTEQLCRQTEAKQCLRDTCQECGRWEQCGQWKCCSQWQPTLFSAERNDTFLRFCVLYCVCQYAYVNIELLRYSQELQIHSLKIRYVFKV